MLPSSHAPDPAPVPPTAEEEGPAQWLRQCWAEGVTADWGVRLSRLGPQALVQGQGAGGSDEVIVALKAFAAMAAMGRGDYELADQLLGAAPEAGAPATLLLDAAARLYRACGDTGREPAHAIAAMNALNEARQHLGAAPGPEAATARGYAGLSLAEALLAVGDVGAARHQLTLVVEEGLAPPALLVAVRSILGGIEQAVGRADLAIGHLQAAVRLSTGLPAEEQLARLLLCGVVLSTDRRYGLALLDEVQARLPVRGRAGQGASARLLRLLRLLAAEAPQEGAASPYPLAVRVEARDLLRHLQGRHYSAGWFLLLTGVCAGALRAGDPCEAYSVLVHAAATLRCRRMDGAAELCDRQIEALRVQLGEERFESLLTEAKQRRQQLSGYAERGA